MSIELLQRGQALIDACRAYCVLMDIEPMGGSDHPIDTVVFQMAVYEYEGNLDALNDNQRRHIAGMGDLLKEDH